MAKKTRSDIIEDLKRETEKSLDYNNMLDKIATYIIKNYKLKKVERVVTITQVVENEND